MSDVALQRICAFAGLFLLTALALPFSSNRKAIRWRPVAGGLGLMLLFAVALLGVPAAGLEFTPMRALFTGFNDGFNALLNQALKGGEFVFGRLASDVPSFGFVFAFQVLPPIVVMSSLMAVLYHLGIMQKTVRAISIVMRRTLGTSGVETLAAAANIFAGHTEAPLAIRPYLARLTRSELFCVMVGGMANTAGGTLAAYVLILRDRVPGAAGHLLTASIISAPAAIAISKIMEPETGAPETLGTDRIEEESANDANALDAAARGASEGLTLALNVAAMLIAFVALIYMINAVLGQAGAAIGFDQWGPGASQTGGEGPRLSLDLLFGWVFSPVALLMGVPAGDCAEAGKLLGQKTVFNEFIAYSNLASAGPALSDRGALILSYALCGFANFGSIAIQIGGIGALVPERRGDLARLGLKSVAGGTIVTCLLGAVAGLIL